MSDLTDREKESHLAARDTAKHLVTLSAAAVGILIAIFKDILGQVPQQQLPTMLWMAFASFALSSLFGLFVLMSLTGNLEKRERPSIYAANVVVPAGLQIIIFAAALFFSGMSVWP